jgi:hypothetical protein
MSEESGNKEAASPEKLLIDDSADFLFHAAYVAYSAAFDKTASPEGRRQLNQSITALQQKQVDYATFYRSISQYRGDEGPQYHHGRAFIETQRKKDWRRKAQKQERIKRHRK